MGVLSNIKAMKDVQKIKRGGKAKLSISQITNLITNMLDAKRNLSDEEYKKVYKLFIELGKCNTKMEMNMTDYCETAVDIIKRFDKIAPYKKYSGGNELEFSFLIDDIYKQDKLEQEPLLELTKEEIAYANSLINSSNGMVEKSEVEEFIQILRTYAYYGKKECLKKFDILANRLINEGPMAIVKVSFFNGVLNANNIITEIEMKNLGDKYQKVIMDTMIKNKDK